MQMGGLLHGVGWGRSRSLEAIAKAELGLAPPKELQLSDWAAERLSPGQIAYAVSDAILTFRLFAGAPCLADRPIDRAAGLVARATVAPNLLTTPAGEGDSQ